MRRVAELDYDVTWVELIEMDGVSPYTYSKSCLDDLLQQHTPGVQSRNRDDPTVVVAALPRADSPSAKRYVAEREGETAWTMHLSEKDAYGVESWSCRRSSLGGLRSVSTSGRRSPSTRTRGRAMRIMAE